MKRALIAACLTVAVGCGGAAGAGETGPDGAASAGATVALPDPAPAASASAVTAEPSATAEPTAAPEPGTPDPDKSYSFVVSFFSPGDGTDVAASDRLEAFLLRAKKQVPRVTGHWGKEGEHDECFSFAELSARKRKAFMADVKQAIGASSKVSYREDAPCRDRGR